MNSENTFVQYNLSPRVRHQRSTTSIQPPNQFQNQQSSLISSQPILTNSQPNFGIKDLSSNDINLQKAALANIPNLSKERIIRSSQYGKKQLISTSSQSPSSNSATSSNLVSPRKTQLGPIINIDQYQTKTPSPTPSPRMNEKSTRGERKMSFKNRNPMIEKRDISIISMDYDSVNILSDKELKNVVKDEAKRQKLLKSQNDKKKTEIILDIQCLKSHVVTHMKRSMAGTVQKTIEKWLKKNSKEIVNLNELEFRNQKGEIIEKTTTIRQLLEMGGNILFITCKQRPFTLPHMYTMDITENDNQVIPQVVYNLCWWIYTYGYQVQGIFRINGNIEYCKTNSELCCFCDLPFLEKAQKIITDVHNVVGVLKMYLRDKTDGILQYEQIDCLTKEKNVYDIDEIIQLLKSIPKACFHSLMIVFGLCVRLKKYESIHTVSFKDFAVVLGPVLIHGASKMRNVSLQTVQTNQIDFCMTILQHYDEICEECEIENPFNELPNRNDIKKFDKEQIEKSLQTIQSMSIESFAECDKLVGLMDNPEVVEFIQTLDKSFLLDVIQNILECIPTD